MTQVTLVFGFLAGQSSLVSVFIAGSISVPVALIAGWFRWSRWRRQWSGIPAFSSVGFLLGTASASLAMAAIAHGRWRYYDPVLLRIYGLGMLISLIGLIFSLIGSFRPNFLRWQAPLLSAAMLALWILWAAAE